MYNKVEKEQAVGYFSKIMQNIYKKNGKYGKVDELDINSKELLKYYEEKHGVYFQKELIDNLQPMIGETLIEEISDDNLQRDEGQDIESYFEKMIQEEINKNNLPSTSFNKDEIMQSLKELSDDEEEMSDLTNEQIKNAVKAAAIKAIYLATLKKYEKNMEQIQKHADIVNRRDGDFALEDRLAAENRQYEVYLAKLAKEYKELNPSHKSITDNEKVNNKQTEIRDEHNKEEEIKEERREDAILAVTAIYDEKEAITEEMAMMSANPSTFSKARFNELQDKLLKADRKLSNLKANPAVLIENVEREERQESLDQRQLGDEKIASKSEKVQIKNKENDEEIKEQTDDNIEIQTNNVQDVIDRYHECRQKGDYQGAVEQYEILETMYGSVKTQDDEVKDMSEDGKENYQTETEKDDNLRENLGLNAVNDSSKIQKLDEMDKRVVEIEKDLPSSSKENKTIEGQSISGGQQEQEGYVRTLNNRRPY